MLIFVLELTSYIEKYCNNIIMYLLKFNSAKHIILDYLDYIFLGQFMAKLDDLPTTIY